ncbi:MAG: aminopeptidase [Thermomicrobiales bacterium]|jgi:putative aminopeptidase FrvX|nr:aminopeptidase [Thermomicrobiales bacterium]
MTPSPLPVVDGRFMLETSAKLCRIPSPTGYTAEAVAFVQDQLASFGLETRRTVKGALIATLPGSIDPTVGGRLLSAHVDTLGAMVKEIKKNGRLKLTSIGTYDWSTIEGEYCTVHTAAGDAVTGTILTTKASFHIHGKALADLKRDEHSIEVRLDERVRTAAEVRALGVEVGDFVSLDPRTTITPNGYIKSRHLDDKACVAILLGIAKAVSECGFTPTTPSYLYVSTFEEVGHGTSAGLPSGVEEVIAVDMAAVGEGQTSDEFATTVCVKDATGPYDHGLSRRLVDLARTHGIDCRTDIYTYYGSDVSQALRAGYDIRGALVGPGVDASHSYERLHQTSLEETARLLLAYLLAA